MHTHTHTQHTSHTDIEHTHTHTHSPRSIHTDLWSHLLISPQGWTADPIVAFRIHGRSLQFFELTLLMPDFNT